MEKPDLPRDAALLYAPTAVETAIARVAAELNADIAAMDPHKPPLVLCVLTGGIVFAGMLLPKLNFPLELDYLHATRYGRHTVGGDLRWIAYPRYALEDRLVILVDDILDEGITLHQIQAHCRAELAERVLTAVLIRKNRTRPVDVDVEYVGLDVPDAYVFGYGMDCGGLWRNAPGVFALPD